MASIARLLADFCAFIGQDQHRPQQKFLLDALFGIHAAGSLMLTEIGRALNEPVSMAYVEKRLSRNLLSARLDDKALLQRHLERASVDTMKNDGEDVVIGVDLTDIAKPYGNIRHGMEHLCVCRDGSTGEKGPGYPVVQIEASLPGDNQRPLLYHVYSSASPGHKSQNHEVLAGVRAVAPYVGPKALWALDRGFDGTGYFKGLDEAKVRWVCRANLKSNSRHVIDERGEKRSLSDVVQHLELPFMQTITVGVKKSRKRKIALRLGCCRLRVLDNGKLHPALYSLVVVAGHSKEPLALLTNQLVTDEAGALKTAAAYRRRWRAEEATRGMKATQQWGVALEKLRSLRFIGVRRLVLLGTLVYAFISELRARPKAVKTVLARVPTLPGPVRDLRYRLLRGIGDILVGVTRKVRLRLRGG